MLQVFNPYRQIVDGSRTSEDKYADRVFNPYRQIVDPDTFLYLISEYMVFNPYRQIVDGLIGWDYAHMDMGF